MRKEDEKLPFFADGSIIGEYKLLFEYWRILREKHRENMLDKAFLKREDFEYIRLLINIRKKMNLQELLDKLTDKFLERIDPDAAQEAFKNVYGIEIDREYARRKIAYVLAGWLIEAARNTGILKY